MSIIQASEAEGIYEALELFGVGDGVINENGNDQDIEIHARLGADRRIEYEIRPGDDEDTIQGTVYREDVPDTGYRVLSKYLDEGGNLVP